ncbi:MAG: hypothetical protein KBF45_14110 [Cyclobacteriaceae bacterium]|jgi:hypothetical protein|nr:hypothetical protein [Cyclobacteriaceae bacterium]
MKKIFLLCLFSALVTVAHAQKKLTPVTKSALTGIGLPNGSKQDSRILSVAAAGTILEMESNKTNTKIQNTEVLVLAPTSVNKFNKDSLIQRLTARGWKITPTEDNNYLWLQKDTRVAIAYFAMNTKQTDLYLAEAISLPVLTTQGANTTGNQSKQTIAQPATQPVNQATELQNSQPIPQTANNLSFLGTWSTSSSNQGYDAANGMSGYIKRQYTFNQDGTYQFVIKTFSHYINKLLLTKESGTYSVNGNSLTIIPQKSVIEDWTKKDGTDKWGTRISSQNRPLEKVTYQFTKHYFSGIDEWNLVLQADKVTERDGPFSSNTTFMNAWYYKYITANNLVVELPEGQETYQQNSQPSSQADSNTLSIIGSWGKSNSVSQVNNRYGTYSYVKYQYTFNSNGTYSFTGKNYSEQYDETLLTKENGTFLISENNITLNPQSRVIEAWSKKNGADNWNQLKSSQKQALEKVTYQFTTVEGNLVLQTDKETVRDGRFSTGNSYSYGPPSTFTTIKLPGE